MRVQEQEMTEYTSGLSRLPLSFGQEQLWFLDQLSPDQTIYNIGVSYRLRGALDIDILRRSLTRLVGRHEALRATFGAMDGVPFQVIAPVRDVELAVSDFTGLEPDEREHALERTLAADAATPFDLELGPLYRFRLCRLAEDDHALSLNFHHIVTDGWSAGVLNRELATIYGALLHGREPAFPVEPVRYADFVASQRQRLRGEALEQELQYWDEQLKGLATLELPADRLRPANPSYRGDSLSMDFPSWLLQDVRKLAYERGASVFMVLISALNMVFARYTDQHDVPLGISLLGRTEPELENTVGLFVNMAVLRTDLSGDPAFADLVDRIADVNLDIYDHQEVPFEKVVERIQPIRDPSRNPLFQVAVQVLGDSTSGANFDLPGIVAETIPVASEESRFDMAINFFESADSLRCDIEYSTDLFDRWRIEALVKHAMRVLEAVVADPSLRLSQVPLTSAAEREELLAAGRGDEAEQTRDPIHVSVAKVANADPGAVAAVCRGKELTYGELNRCADLVARYLRSLGVQHEQIVAIAMDRDLDTLVAMLGVLKSGAAFTVIDPAHPAKRLDYILRDTATPLVITRSALADGLPTSRGWATVLLDADWDATQAAPEPKLQATPDSGSAEEHLPQWATRDSLAYVLYTSGSTGQPKGVLIEHRALTCFTEAYRRTFGFTSDDRLLQLPALTFDMSMGEIFTALTAGATLVLLSPEDALSPEGIAKLMRDQRVTYAGLTPAILSVVEAEPYPHLRYIMSGADAVPAEMVNKWNLPGRRFVDLYGPTEAAVACTEYECEHVEWQTPPPIGHPEQNRLVYVVDRWGNLVPKGIAGELLIGGDEGLARGYLNQPELTAEKFVADPFRPRGRVYRSGDLVRWTPDYELEFLGRIDHQVKLRGLRIELGEIESALLTHPQVRMAAVLLRPDQHGEKRLVGYFTTEGDQAPAVADLRRHLVEQLPEYMVPTAWALLEAFPLTAARKINRAALPEPDMDGNEPEFVVARTPTEACVAEIFAEVLSVPRVGADENFFELGGNSLQAMRVVSRINKAFGVKVNIRLLYGSSTVSAISTAIEGMTASASR